MKNHFSYRLKLGGLALFFVAFMITGPFTTGQISSLDDEINSLNQQIQGQKKQLEQLRERQKEYQLQIEAKQKEKASLNNQISILENRMAKAQLDIESANLEIDKTGLEIKKIEADSQNLDEEIEEQKNHIASLLRTMYQQGQSSTLEILLLHGSLAEFLNQARYLESANQEIGYSVNDLRRNKEKLDANKASLQKKSEELVALKKQLNEKKESLSYEQANKSYLLEETSNSEKEYQELLQRAKREQQQAEADIASAERSIRQKMSEKDRARLNSGNNTIAWPVPKNVITAGFRDATYPYKGIIGEHSAVDIRAKQGTAITAAADGYVARVKFDGTTAYSYIMLVHGDGLSTVYGHISAAHVVADQYVTQGQVIGKTGGTPGTIGAGPFTTGPHLHFEVRLNGLPVNPANYLP